MLMIPLNLVTKTNWPEAEKMMAMTVFENLIIT